MTVERETYTELLHAMMFAIVKDDLSIGQAASVMFACAQPDTTEELIDMTRDVRDRLTDWSQESKGRLIAIEGVKMTFKCVNMHGPCERGEHTVFMARICGSDMWRPEDVVSRHNFDEVLLEVIKAQHPHGDQQFRVRHGQVGRGLIGAFAEMFAEQPESIDDKVKDFRAELDALFPSNPQPGKEETNESS